MSGLARRGLYRGASLALALLFLAWPWQPGAWSAVKTGAPSGSLGVIVEKDLFRPSRQKPRPPKPRPAPPVQPALPPPPPPKSPPPALTLSGTIILESGGVALMAPQGSPGTSARYTTGDEIGGFRVTDIASESVTLVRDDEVLRVWLDPRQAYTGPGRQGAPAPGAPPSDIPGELVPRPPAHFQRAPYR